MKAFKPKVVSKMVKRGKNLINKLAQIFNEY